jgi:hypothetical protein
MAEKRNRSFFETRRNRSFSLRGPSVRTQFIIAVLPTQL